MQNGDLKTQNTEGERYARGWTATVVFSPGRGFRARSYRLSEPLIVLGRDPRSDYAAIRIDDPAVSRAGVILRMSGDHYELTDEGSHNPVRVNGAAVQRRIVGANDVIRLGDTLIVIDRDDPARQPRSRGNLSDQRVEQLLERLSLKQSTAAALVRLEGSIIEPDLRSLVIWSPGVLESRHVGEWLAGCWDQPLTIVDANAEGALAEIQACPASHVLLVDRLDLAAQGAVPRIAREIERRFSGGSHSLTITSLERRLRRHPTPAIEQAVSLICHFDLVIPPLRERRADILLAMAQMLDIPPEERPQAALTADVCEFFLLYDWPLGLAELQRHTFHLKSMIRRGEQGVSLVPTAIREHVHIDAGELSQPLNAERVRDALSEFGNMKDVAAYFGYSRTYFYRLLQREGIDIQSLRRDLKLEEGEDE